MVLEITKLSDYKITKSGAPDYQITKSLSVNVPQHHINASDGRDDVRNQPSFAHFCQRLQVRVRRSAHVDAIRFRRAVADDVVAHLTARRFDRLVHLARGNRKALG